METKTMQKSFLALLLAIPIGIWADNPRIRPGKGMDVIPGDIAEYTNTLYENDKKSELPSCIMLSAGKQDELEGVRVIMSNGDKLISVRTVLYDLSKEKSKQGQVIDSGTERITVCDKQYDCQWEKIVDNGMTATYWTSDQLPFEKYARVVIEQEGKKQVTELSVYDPEMMSEEFIELQSRLRILMAQARKNGHK